MKTTPNGRNWLHYFVHSAVMSRCIFVTKLNANITVLLIVLISAFSRYAFFISCFTASTWRQYELWFNWTLCFSYQVSRCLSYPPTTWLLTTTRAIVNVTSLVVRSTFQQKYNIGHIYLFYILFASTTVLLHRHIACCFWLLQFTVILPVIANFMGSSCVHLHELWLFSFYHWYFSLLICVNERGNRIQYQIPK